MDNTWELMVLIRSFNDAMKNVKEYSKEEDEVEELYAQAIRLQCRKDFYGLVLPINDFIKWVDDCSLVNYDGGGCFADWDGNRHEIVSCDVKWLERNKKDYPFVFWFNK